MEVNLRYYLPSLNKLSSKLVNIKQYLNLHSNDIVLLYKASGKFQFDFDKDEISKANAVSSLIF